MPASANSSNTARRLLPSVTTLRQRTLWEERVCLAWLLFGLPDSVPPCAVADCSSVSPVYNQVTDSTFSGTMSLREMQSTISTRKRTFWLGHISGLKALFTFSTQLYAILCLIIGRKSPPARVNNVWSPRHNLLGNLSIFLVPSVIKVASWPQNDQWYTTPLSTGAGLTPVMRNQSLPLEAQSAPPIPPSLLYQLRSFLPPHQVK